MVVSSGILLNVLAYQRTSGNFTVPGEAARAVCEMIHFKNTPKKSPLETRPFEDKYLTDKTSVIPINGAAL